MRLQLLGLGLQVVGAHQFGHHQAQAHAALGLRLEQLVRDRRGLGILDAALLQVCARAFIRRSSSLPTSALGTSSCDAADQRVHHRRLVARQHAELALRAPGSS